MPLTTPAAGAVNEIVGGVVSGTTVTLVSPDAGPTFPAASTAATR
jgi:hypothetical protein